jgi:hypothetical protein
MALDEMKRPGWRETNMMWSYLVSDQNPLSPSVPGFQ